MDDSLRKTLDDNMNKLEANARQEGGNHYKNNGRGEQHWDRVHRLKMNWYAANVTKYVERYPQKNGLEDLKKARHYLDKLIEVETERYQNGVMTKPGYGAVMSVQEPPRHVYDGRPDRDPFAD